MNKQMSSTSTLEFRALAALRFLLALPSFQVPRLVCRKHLSVAASERRFPLSTPGPAAKTLETKMGIGLMSMAWNSAVSNSPVAGNDRMPWGPDRLDAAGTIDFWNRFQEITGWRAEFDDVGSAAVPTPKLMAGRRRGRTPSNRKPFGNLQLHRTGPTAIPEDAARRLVELYATFVPFHAATGVDDNAASDARCESLSRSLPAATVTETAERMLEIASRRLGFTAGTFFLRSSDGRRFCLRLVRGCRAEQVPQPVRHIHSASAEGHALRQGVAVIHRDSSESVDALPDEAGTALCVPVAAGETVVGMLWLYDSVERHLSDAELRLAKVIGTRLGALLEKHVLLTESRTRKRLSQELSVAAKKMPAVVLPSFPSNWKLDVAIRSGSQSELGGDLCDVMVLDERIFGIAVGDAVGHGVPAAMLSAVTRGAIRAHLHNAGAEPPERIIAALNQTLHAVTEGEQFLSMLYGTLHVDRKSFTYCNAGHPLPILLRGDRRIPMNSHGLLLGISGQAGYSQTTVRLETGDRLILFTDGITETRNSRDCMYGTDRLIDIAAKSHSADSIAANIWDDVHSFADLSDEGDDRTLAVVTIG